jgi:hypothetical protein
VRNADCGLGIYCGLLILLAIEDLLPIDDWRLIGGFIAVQSAINPH